MLCASSNSGKFFVVLDVWLGLVWFSFRVKVSISIRVRVGVWVKCEVVIYEVLCEVCGYWSATYCIHRTLPIFAVCHWMHEM